MTSRPYISTPEREMLRIERRRPMNSPLSEDEYDRQVPERTVIAKDRYSSTFAASPSIKLLDLPPEILTIIGNATAHEPKPGEGVKSLGSLSLTCREMRAAMLPVLWGKFGVEDKNVNVESPEIPMRYRDLCKAYVVLVNHRYRDPEVTYTEEPIIQNRPLDYLTTFSIANVNTIIVDKIVMSDTDYIYWKPPRALTPATRGYRLGDDPSNGATGTVLHLQLNDPTGISQIYPALACIYSMPKYLESPVKVAGKSQGLFDVRVGEVAAGAPEEELVEMAKQTSRLFGKPRVVRSTCTLDSIDQDSARLRLRMLVAVAFGQERSMGARGDFVLREGSPSVYDVVKTEICEEYNDPHLDLRITVKRESNAKDKITAQHLHDIYSYGRADNGIPRFQHLELLVLREHPDSTAETQGVEVWLTEEDELCSVSGFERYVDVPEGRGVRDKWRWIMRPVR